MTSDATNKTHEKHAKLTRPALGEFGRNEIAIVGTTCANIKNIAFAISNRLSPLKIAYVDADHKAADGETNNPLAVTLEYTDKISFQRLDFKQNLNPFQKRVFFNEQDLIIINGNHFQGKNQIVVIDPRKDLEKKVEKLTDVRLILLTAKEQAVPDFLTELPNYGSIPVLHVEDEEGIANFVKSFVSSQIPALYGLVLSGGESSRMQKDKGSLDYHGNSQREHLYKLLSKYCEKTFVSCNQKQAAAISANLPVIQDSFLHLGPIGGILSALQSNPDAAWLAVACDLPYLSDKTIEYLVQNRNPSKVATAFLDPKGEFPEPLVAIWEPKSYPVLLQFLSQGFSCPRKALINSDIELLKAPDEKEFLNANFPKDYEIAWKELSASK